MNENLYLTGEIHIHSSLFLQNQIHATHPIWAEGACISRFKSKTKADREANWHAVLGTNEVFAIRRLFQRFYDEDKQCMNVKEFISFTEENGATELALTSAFSDIAKNETFITYEQFFAAIIDLKLQNAEFYDTLQGIAESDTICTSSTGSISAGLNGIVRDEDRFSTGHSTTTASIYADSERDMDDRSYFFEPPSPTFDGNSSTSIVTIPSRTVTGDFGISSFSMELTHDIDLHCSIAQPTYAAGLVPNPEQVDYVFYTSHFQIRMEQPPTFSVSDLSDGLPTQLLPSDHVASVVDFAWNRLSLIEAENNIKAP